MTFTDFFQTATRTENLQSGIQPFPYQIAFAEGPCLCELVHAPTGSGKTATAILGWLWRYFYSGIPTPCRLVYCLPMRVLVEQTRDEAKKWIGALKLPVKVYILMGGEDNADWDLDPEKPAILIGTQDMLLSRALNRGYGMSRFRWPMHYALLNNDCLWVVDEIQLMSVGLATSAQLQAFREKFRTFGEAKTVWMSATLRPDWLATVDFRDRVPQLSTLNLNKQDYAADGLRERWIAKKAIENSKLSSDDADELAAFIKDKHQPNSLTLVVVNTVKRSCYLYAAVNKLCGAGKPASRGKKPKAPSETTGPQPKIHLIHSRFRPKEREGWMKWLKDAPPAEGRIIISTQVVEAGVDMSARTLLTELAPWPSLVQRFGRCNRRGEFTKDQPAQAYWIDVPAEDNKDAAPYTKVELDAARRHLRKLDDAGLRSLHEFSKELSDREQQELFPYDPPHLIRRKDFIDLFDTTPDLAGNDIDVSRFIREGEDLDVQVFWRATKPDPEWTTAELRHQSPRREELCPVPVGAFHEFIEKAKKTAFRWDSLDGRWRTARADDVYPGQVFWIPEDQGGYSLETGWDPKGTWPSDANLEPPARPEATTEEPEYDSDLLSLFGWRSIAEHTDDVVAELIALTEDCKLDGIPWEVLQLAARWHDWGKAHPTFQDAIKDGTEKDGKRPVERAGKRDIAKAAPRGFWGRYRRKHFRHELASAIGVLTLLRSGQAPADWAGLDPQGQNLALYLIAAHHGKARLSIRSMPDECKPEGQDKLFARGIWDGDELPAMPLGGGITAACVKKLDLSPMKLGRCTDGSPSWAERMLFLRDHPDFGPLRLAYLEALLRAADMCASKKADEKAQVKNA
jgi:CRISPR-associated endonuclease/helicase Cas3